MSFLLLKFTLGLTKLVVEITFSQDGYFALLCHTSTNVSQNDDRHHPRRRYCETLKFTTHNNAPDNQYLQFTYF